MATDNTEKKKPKAKTAKSPATKSTATKKVTTKASTGTKKKTNSTKTATKKTTKPVAKNTKTAPAKSKKNASTKKTTAKSVSKKTEIKPVEIDLSEKETIVTSEIVSDLHIEEPTLKTDLPKEEPATKKDDAYEITSILGAKLPTGKTIEDKKIRKKHYLKDSFVFALIIPLIDLLAMFFFEAYKPFDITDIEWVNYGINLVFDFVVIFIITYVIDYALSEDDVKKNGR